MTKRTTPVTLLDVARAAGVSTATVSRCLNGDGIVRPATRERVLRAVADLDYAPNFAGRALVRRRSDTIGAVVPTIDNAIFARAIGAMQERLRAAGVILLLASSNYDPAREAEQVRALVARGADGVMLIGTARPSAIYGLLRARGVPYVLAWSWRGATSEHVRVGFDNGVAAGVLARHLIGLGHRRFGVIAGIGRDNDRARDRLDAYRTAIGAAGLDLPEAMVEERPYDLAEGGAALRALMARAPRPTAVLCGNDVLAAGALFAAEAMGVRVPDDLSIAGFDDIDLAAATRPRLTTIHVPHRRIGALAADALLALRRGESATSRKLDVELVVRESTAAPAPRLGRGR